MSTSTTDSERFPSIQQSRPSNALLVEAFDMLRSAGMMMTVAFILYMVGMLAGMGVVFAALSMGQHHHPATIVLAGIGGAGAMVVCIVIGMVLGLIALFAKLIPGASRLAQYSPTEFSTPSSLIKVGLVGLFLLLIIAAILFGGAVALRSPAMALGALGLGIVAAILGIIGFVGLVLLCFRIDSRFGSGSFLAAGILFIISMLLGGLPSFIAWILIWAGAGTLKSKAERGEIG